MSAAIAMPRQRRHDSSPGGPFRAKNCTKGRQQGFSLITAIFLLVVVVSLGALMMTFFSVQQQSSALDVLGARAYQASRAGIEWGAFKITKSQVAGSAFASACQGGPTTSNLSMANTPLAQYTLVVSCAATSHVENASPASTVWAYNITASASGIGGTTPGNPDYVERVTQATIWQ